MRGRFSGFFSAMILAVGSFFVLFLFFPDLSDRFFGVSVKHGNVVQPAETENSPVRTSDGLSDFDVLKNETKKVVDTLVNTTVDKVSDKMSEKVTQKFSNIINGGGEKKTPENTEPAVKTQEEPKTKDSPVSDRIDIKKLLD